jgi:hypothetical protein
VNKVASHSAFGIKGFYDKECLIANQNPEGFIPLQGFGCFSKNPQISSGVFVERELRAQAKDVRNRIRMKV